MWGEPRRSLRVITPSAISTHSPRVGRTQLNAVMSKGDKISTHSPRVGRTSASARADDLCRDFNSLAPCGANLSCKLPVSLGNIFQLTRPVWGEPSLSLLWGSNVTFQLTRPVWGEPIRFTAGTLPRRFQLTRPVWGEPFFAINKDINRTISTHSPRVGRTHSCLL